MTTRLRLAVAALCASALLCAGAAPAQTSGPGAAPMMRAIVHRSYGPPEVLRLEAVERPVPNDDQLLIKVRAGSVNPLDWHFMRGTPYILRVVQTGLLAPKVGRLGVDFAGTVEAVGAKVTRFKPGDEVFGGRNGALAEYVCVREDRAVALKPANMTFEQAGAVPVAAITALQGLRDKGGIRPGQKVLINGASGGVGTFAVQIARSFGAHVTGVCSTRNVDMVRSIGADQVIDYTREDFTSGGQRYDLILDMVGNHSLSEYRRVLTPDGSLVQVGSTDVGLWLGPFVDMLRTFLLSRFMSQNVTGMLATLNGEDLATLRDLMQDGKVTPVIDRRYALRDAAEAIRYLEGGRARGKVIVTMEEDDAVPPAGAAPAPAAVSTIGPALALIAPIVVAVGVPIIVALALNRRFQRRHPGKRPYRWGYYVSTQTVVGGIVLGLMLEAGVGAAIVCGVLYAILAWFFARRHRWAWIVLTMASFNPVVWIINLVYLRRRWAEDSAAAR